MSSKTKSQAKLMMIKFIKATVNDPLFSFRLRGDEEDAKKFVHRMRVELSRMRDIVKESGRMPKEFKVLTDSIEHNPMDGITLITLRKSVGANAAIAEDLDEIFDEIAGGNRG